MIRTVEQIEAEYDLAFAAAEATARNDRITLDAFGAACERARASYAAYRRARGDAKALALATAQSAAGAKQTAEERWTEARVVYVRNSLRLDRLQVVHDRRLTRARAAASQGCLAL